MKFIWSMSWYLRTIKWDDSKKIAEYKRRKSISHIYGYAYCELYISEMQYERALVFCEAGLEKKPDDEALLRRRKQLLKILQREKTVKNDNDIVRQN
ncbi:MAG: hypothetical protein H3C30_18100 [Candidatus Hydrogenedentes bacterium]|nr:hypothetical protein [Candidatus Hydrogenedentota bacterium]